MSAFIQHRWEGLDKPGWRSFAVTTRLGITAALILALAPPVYAQGVRVHEAEDRRVVILPVGKLRDKTEYESRIEFRTACGQLLCALDYSSETNEHGFGVAKAAWTPDTQYFVFSLTSSGGHQAWHSPIHFYSRRTGMILLLDDYQNGAGTSNGNFQLFKPDIVETAILKDDEIPTRFRLGSLGSPNKSRPIPPQRIQCSGGKTFRPTQ